MSNGHRCPHRGPCTWPPTQSGPAGQAQEIAERCSGREGRDSPPAGSAPSAVVHSAGSASGPSRVSRPTPPPTAPASARPGVRGREACPVPPITIPRNAPACRCLASLDRESFCRSQWTGAASSAAVAHDSDLDTHRTATACEYVGGN